MKTNRPAAHSQSGFTLIELLSAAAISAILILSLNTVLYNAFNLRDSSVESSNKTSAQLYAVNLMTRDFKHMLPPGEGLAGDVFGEDLGGRSMPISVVEFFTSNGAIEPSEPWGDIQFVEYSLKEITALETEETRNDNVYYLVRSVEQNILSYTEEEPAYQPVLANVKGFLVSYYDGEVWADYWDSGEIDEEETERLPQAVRVQILIEDKKDGSSIAAQSNQQRLEQIEFIVPITTQSITQPEDEQDEQEAGAEENNQENQDPNNDGQNQGGGGR